MKFHNHFGRSRKFAVANRAKLLLETLEERAVPTVTAVADTGDGIVGPVQVTNVNVLSNDTDTNGAVADVVAANINVVQNDTANNQSSVTVTVTESLGDFRIIGGNRGDYDVQIGDTRSDDVSDGILITSVAQNGTDHGQEDGFLIGTSSIDNSGGAGYFIPLHHAPGGGEYNSNVSAGYFPFSDFIAGHALNSSNGGAITLLNATGGVFGDYIFFPTADGVISTRTDHNTFTTSDDFLDGVSPDESGLFRFDDFIGTNLNQVSAGTTIVSARLVLTTTTVGFADSGGPYTVHELLTGFDPATTTYQNSYGGNGLDEAGGDIGPSAGSYTGMGSGDVVSVDVTSIVQGWLNGNTNHGFGVKAGTSNGWSIFFSEAANPAVRPRLEITTSTSGQSTFTDNGNGQFGLNIAGVNSQTDGVLLVNGGKNEDNFALAQANGDGSWTIYNHDNGANGASYEQDPVAFVYIPNGTPGIISGRVTENGAKTITNGSFTVVNESDGVIRLTIDGQSPNSGTLLISAEGGVSNNVDNIVTFEPDGNSWVIQSRDLPQNPPTLQNVGDEDAFSFAFIPHAPASLVVSDAGDTGTGTNLISDAGATLTIEDDNTISYDPSTASLPTLQVGQSTTDTFVYTARNPSSGETDTATVTVTVTNVNDAPVAVNPLRRVTLTNPTATDFDVSNVFDDADLNFGDSLTLSVSVPDPSLLSAAVDDSTLTLEYTEAAFGGTSVDLTATDSGGNSATITIQVFIDPADGPARDDSETTVKDQVITVNVLNNDFHTDSGTLADYYSAANIDVVQNDTGNTGSSITLTTPQSSGGFQVTGGSRGDYTVQIGASRGDDVSGGILIGSIAQHIVDHGQSDGALIGTIAIDNSGGSGYFLPLHDAPVGGEYNSDAAAAYFSFAKGWIAGHALNSTNGGPITSFNATPGLFSNFTFFPTADGVISTRTDHNVFDASDDFLDGNSPDESGLFRFDGLIGGGVGQVPAGTQIAYARLVLTTSTAGSSPSGGPYNVHQLLSGFDPATTTYQNSFGGDGLDETGGDIGPSAGSYTGMSTSEAVYVDVTGIVQNWLDGEANHGFAVKAGTSDGWSIYFSEVGDAALQPRLEVFTTDGGRFFNNNIGESELDLTGVGINSQTDGVLLVNGGKNEDNYALARANADGTWTIFNHDNGANGASYEQDPVAFAFIPNNAPGVISGRVTENGAQSLANGSFTTTNPADGIIQLTIPGQSPTTGTLIISAEGGVSNNVDNIVTYEWNVGGGFWEVQTRDLDQNPPTLQNVGNEDAFSFAFIPFGVATSDFGIIEVNGNPIAPTGTATTAEGATVTFNTDGTFSYDPTGSATLQAIPNGSQVIDTFTYTVRDGKGGTDTATVSVTVTGGDGPIANDDTATTDEQSIVTVAVLNNDTDPTKVVVAESANILGSTNPSISAGTDGFELSAVRSNTGDYHVIIDGDPSDDVANGILISSVSELSRGGTFATSAVAVNPNSPNDYLVSVWSAPGGAETDINTAAAYFPFDEWIGGIALNSSNGGAIDQLIASPNIFLNAAPSNADFVFQQGLNGYNGVEDGVISSTEPNTDFGAGTDFLDGTSPDEVGYFHFSSFVGFGPGQINPNTTIVEARLTLTTNTAASSQTGGRYSVHKLTQQIIPIIANYQDDFGTDGPQVGQEIEAETDSFTGASQGEAVVLDVTSIVQDWINGQNNNGFLVQDNVTTDGWGIHFSESGSAALRPRLEIFVNPPSTTPGSGVFQDNGNGTFNLTLDGINSQADGVLLVNGGKDEDNYALSQANSDGSWTIFNHDNGANGGTYEQDPVAFVFIPSSRTDVISGRVTGDGTKLIASGDFTVTPAGTGTQRLSIPGFSPNDGVLLISPEGGVSLNVDNILSYQPDGNSWLIETRDLTGAGLQDLNAEPAFNFAFFPFETDQPLTVTELNGNPVSVGTPVMLGSGALVTFNNDGTFSYDPNGQFENLAVGANTTDSFQYTIEDPDGQSSTATAVVTINGVNDRPFVADPFSRLTAQTTQEDVDLVVDLSTVGFADIDTVGESFTYSVMANNNPGLLDTPVSGNDLTLDVQPNQYGVAFLTIQATDSGGESVVGYMQVNVTPVVDGGLAAGDDTLTGTDEDTPINIPGADLLVNDGSPDTLTPIQAANINGSASPTLAGSTTQFFLRTGSGAGIYNIQIGPQSTDDQPEGVLISAIRENNAPGTTAVGLGSSDQMFVPVWSSPGGTRTDLDVASAYFPFANGFIGGVAVNSANNGPLTQILGNSPVGLATDVGGIITFQQGLNGYSGTVDGIIHENGTNNFTAGSIFLDGPGSGSPNIHGLFRFDDLFGNGPGQIPPGSLIVDANLTLTTTVTGNGQSGGPYTVHQLLVPFDTSANWNNPFGGDGPDEVSGEIGASVASFTGMSQGNPTSVNVTSIVQNWSNGQPNHGFDVMPGTSDGWSVEFSENGNAANRPALEITYIPTNVPVLTDLGGGVYNLRIPGVNSQTDGVLLVNGGKDEDNYALSEANADGSWTLFVHDNGVNGGSYEPDPVAFVYVPSIPNNPSTPAIPNTDRPYVSGKVTGNGTQLVASGDFTVTQVSTGTVRLAINGFTPADGALIISAEGGDNFNVDNIVTYEADGSTWLIQTRDLAGAGLQSVGTAEAMFSFAFMPFGPSATAAPSIVSVQTTSDLGATVTLNPDGSIDYDPTTSSTLANMDTGQSMDDTFTYTIDNGSLTAVGTVTVPVTGIDDPLSVTNPIADISADEDDPDVVIDLTNHFEGNSLTFQVTMNTHTGLVTSNVNGNNLTLDFQPDQYGTAFITVSASDGIGTVSDTFQVIVNPVADDPVANDDTAATDEDTAITISDLLDDDTDADILLYAYAANIDGDRSITSNGSVIWTIADAAPEPWNLTILTNNNVGDVGLGLNGAALDRSVGVLLGSLRDNVNPYATVNSFEVFGTYGFSTHNGITDGETNIPIGAALFPYANGFIGAASNSTASGFFGSNGLTPADMVQTGTGLFEVTVPFITDSGTDGYLFPIGGANDDNATSARPLPGTNRYELRQIDNDSGGGNENDDISFVWLPTNLPGLVAGRVAPNGTVLQSSGTFTVTDEGTGTWRLSIPGHSPDSGVLILNASTNAFSVPDDNVVHYEADGNDFLIYNRDLPGFGLQETDMQFAFIPFRTPDTLTVTGVQTTSDLGAAVTLNPDGTVDYDPTGSATLQALPPGTPVTDTFTYTISDSTNRMSTATVTVTVNGVNDAPTVADVAIDATEDGPSVTEDFAGDDVDSDDDQSSLTYTITSALSEGSVINNNDGTFTFDPGTDFQDLSEGATRDVTFDYKATDSHSADSSSDATVMVTVTGVNDVPMITAGPSDTNLAFGGTLSGAQFTFTDPDASDTWDYTVDFGDGLGVSGQMSVTPGIITLPDHEFNHSGINPVTITLTENRGTALPENSVTFSFDVTVDQPTTVFVDDDWAGLNIGDDPNSTPDTPGIGPDYFGLFDSGAGSGPQGGDAFDNFTDALTAVADGGTIIVMPGTYSEATVQVNKTVTIIGQSGTASDAVLTPTSGDGFVISADDVTLQNLQVTGAEIGISADNVSGLELSNVESVLNTTGFSGTNLGGTLSVDDSTFSNNTGDGFRVDSFFDIVYTINTANNNGGMGLHLSNGGTASLFGSTFDNTTLGSGTGIRVDSGTEVAFEPSNGTNSNQVLGGTTGLILDGTTTTVTGATLNDMTFNDQTGNHIVLSGGVLFSPDGPLALDATSATFDGLVGISMTPAEVEATDEQLIHYPDTGSEGLIFLQDSVAYMDGNNLVLIGTQQTDRLLSVNSYRPNRTRVSGVNSAGGTNGIFDLSAPDSTIIIFGLDGRDVIRVTGYVPAVVYGMGGNDYIYGGYASDIIFGGAGNDYIRAGLGNDLVFGGSGRDYIYGDAGNDILSGGSLSDDKSIVALFAIIDDWSMNGSLAMINTMTIDDNESDVLSDRSGRDAMNVGSGDRAFGATGLGDDTFGF